ncbi:LysM peptidoglycan-binding domain-containing protein [Candidatus Dojkabacteria bacterium]|nr:LysM peptidoglycan-binding domain-containing protein [Candidatus Dojkabacteria bacterium]
MSRKVVLGVLALIVFLNVFVIGYVLIDRARDDDENDDQKEEMMQEGEEDEESEKDEENKEDSESSEDKSEDANADEADTGDEGDEGNEEGEVGGDDTGSIPENGNYTEKEKELNAGAIEKSEANRNLMKELGTWIATNYAPEDIQTEQYTVHRGDTLWEISEAYYGTGADWHKILDLNEGEIGYLSNGSQALIVPGQVLTLK